MNAPPYELAPTTIATERMNIWQLGSIFCLGFICFLLASTIVLALIPVYLSTKDVQRNNGHNTFYLLYSTSANGTSGFTGNASNLVQIETRMNQALGLNNGLTVRSVRVQTAVQRRKRNIYSHLHKREIRTNFLLECQAKSTTPCVSPVCINRRQEHIRTVASQIVIIPNVSFIINSRDSDQLSQTSTLTFVAFLTTIPDGFAGEPTISGQYVAIRSGEFSNPSIWTERIVPFGNCSVAISSGITVTISRLGIELNIHRIDVYGTLVLGSSINNKFTFSYSSTINVYSDGKLQVLSTGTSGIYLPVGTTWNFFPNAQFISQIATSLISYNPLTNTVIGTRLTLGTSFFGPFCIVVSMSGEITNSTISCITTPTSATTVPTAPATATATTNSSSSRTWDEAIASARTFVGRMTLEEKCNMTAGVTGLCSGNILSIPRLNFNGLCLQDTPRGVNSRALFSTAFPPAIQIAATWDQSLFYEVAVAIGKEFRSKGINIVLGPMMNMDRNALSGRNWEGFGADPYLSGENSFYYVQGIQDQGVITTAKHFICNEQETNRFVFIPNATIILNGSSYLGYSSNVDDKTIHEIYLWPFVDSVAAGAGSVMCSYNQVNGTPACQHNKLLNGILKGELEFHGYLVSDWYGAKTGIQSVVAGLDIEMPGGDGLLGYSLEQAVKNGLIEETRINDMVIRILTPYFLLRQDEGYPSLDFDYDATNDNYKISQQVGTAGMILLKNTNNVLPFNVNKDKYYSVYGSAAGRFSDSLTELGAPLGSNGNLIIGLYSGGGFDGALYEGGGSGYARPAYTIDPLSSLLMKARDSHLQIQYVINQTDYAAINNSFNLRGSSNAKCLVFINAWSTESYDRPNLHAFNDGDKLVQTVASHCNNTIVIVNSVSQLNLEAWIDHPNVKGAIWAGLPGPEYGPAIVNVLFGDYNPGGKLVFTLAKNDSDYGTNITDTFNSNYTEGVFLDYRHFDRYNIVPRFYFGYGLSYTTFSFSNLAIFNVSTSTSTTASQYRQRRMRSYTNIGTFRIYEPVYEIKFIVTNTGQLNGSEVPQLYIGFPAEAEEPPKVLRGFERVYLAAGESKQITLILTQRDISYWNVVMQRWTVALGSYTVWISTSADPKDIKLQSSFLI